MYEFRNHVIMQYACLKATITYIQYIIYSITYIQYITYSITYIQYIIYSITYTQYIIYILFPIFIVTQSMSHAFFGGSCKATYMHGASCHITIQTLWTAWHVFIWFVLFLTTGESRIGSTSCTPLTKSYRNCPNNNLNLRIKTEPVTVGAGATEYILVSVL